MLKLSTPIVIPTWLSTTKPVTRKFFQSLKTRSSLCPREGRSQKDKKSKIALEEAHKSKLSKKAARPKRRDAKIIYSFKGSWVGLAEEAMVRGFDPAVTMSDMIFGNPGTDVLDVGSDPKKNPPELLNS
ncbi:hypothetical protein PDIG_02720 [Penicillium digitatum PHI26]|uniref:Uncharacterized protein n=1 Tax=Penicillium digitatum (strain PHI26 / CECT 20796) TaxID=1170229 RepID=K9GC21_PEND2|nr:hypothetical protein PDIG_02720 [Penicillium digitatum PHI26]